MLVAYTLSVSTIVFVDTTERMKLKHKHRVKNVLTNVQKRFKSNMPLTSTTTSSNFIQTISSYFKYSSFNQKNDGDVELASHEVFHPIHEIGDNPEIQNTPVRDRDVPNEDPDDSGELSDCSDDIVIDFEHDYNSPYKRSPSKSRMNAITSFKLIHVSSLQYELYVREGYVHMCQFLHYIISYYI